ncbi:hypothetical protein WR25_17357 [Diploscapter pachys]|uniref:Uncharacterized protein n=1 Tax=Diploscapter pachys TaxID=2018661 RepID=A0A2A2M556_9BILA|nr:hypothetical protein WR25_17357 [Diploscapter pachys]
MRTWVSGRSAAEVQACRRTLFSTTGRAQWISNSRSFCCLASVLSSKGSGAGSSRPVSNSAMGRNSGRGVGPGPGSAMGWPWLMTTGRTQLLSMSSWRCCSINSTVSKGSGAGGSSLASSSALGRNSGSGGATSVS